MACINSTAMSEGNSLNCRSFEIAGAGGLQIMEYRQAIEDCFDPGKDIETYSSLDELIEKLHFYGSNEAASRVIREASVKRVLGEHTYKHRLETILSILKQ